MSSFTNGARNFGHCILNTVSSSAPAILLGSFHGPLGSAINGVLGGAIGLCFRSQRNQKKYATMAGITITIINMTAFNPLYSQLKEFKACQWSSLFPSSSQSKGLPPPQKINFSIAKNP